jgi:hypothetical protein
MDNHGKPTLALMVEAGILKPGKGVLECNVSKDVHRAGAGMVMVGVDGVLYTTLKRASGPGLGLARVSERSCNGQR